MQQVIEIINGIPRHPLYRMNEPLNFSMGFDEHLAIVGPNGGGKSLLVGTVQIKVSMQSNKMYFI